MEPREFGSTYNADVIKVMSSAEKNVMWNENLENVENPFVSFAQVLLSKTSTILNNSTLAVSLVHTVLLSFSRQLS